VKIIVHSWIYYKRNLQSNCKYIVCFFSLYQLPLVHHGFSMYFWRGEVLFLFFFIFIWQIAISALYTVNLFFMLCYVKFVLKIYLQLYQNIFLPIKQMRNNLKCYANMKLLTYRSFFFFNLKYTLQKCNRLYFKFKR
jgi:hypothetical protein